MEEVLIVGKTLLTVSSINSFSVAVEVELANNFPIT